MPCWTRAWCKPHYNINEEAPADRPGLLRIALCPRVPKFVRRILIHHSSRAHPAPQIHLYPPPFPQSGSQEITAFQDAHVHSVAITAHAHIWNPTYGVRFIIIHKVAVTAPDWGINYPSRIDLHFKHRPHTPCAPFSSPSSCSPPAFLRSKARTPRTRVAATRCGSTALSCCSAWVTHGPAAEGVRAAQ